MTVVPHESLLYLTIWPTGLSKPTASTLNAPTGQIIANGAVVGAGTSGAISVYVSGTTDVIIDVDGYFSAQSQGNSTALGTGVLPNNQGAYNTGVGLNALNANTTGSQNTAVGASALQANTSGLGNTATGLQALQYNTTGEFNVGNGNDALQQNTTGGSNTGIGAAALIQNSVGSFNVAIGIGALGSGPSPYYNTAIGAFAAENTQGSGNVAIGSNAMRYASSNSSDNIVIGNEAGVQLTTGQNNIEIGNPATSSDSQVIRIGDPAYQTSAYIAGISGVTVSGSAVLINSSGQLGVQSSSIRYKKDVHDMATDSDNLMNLRPVEFRYKQPEVDGRQPLQFGLVAEEVAKIYPDLVVRNKDGQIDTVQYHQLPAMLLNELQKQHRIIEALKKERDEQNRKMEALESTIERLNDNNKH